MSFSSAAGCRPLPLGVISLLSVFLAAAPSQRQTSVAPITMEQEQHHHLVFENAYIKAFYVEIPPHDRTLYHRHDLPYLSLSPPLLGSTPPTSSGGPPSGGPRVGYMAGGFSHTVTNSRDVALRNVAIELLRRQGTVRNRCAQVIPEQLPGTCNKPTLDRSVDSVNYPLFETDEIAVQGWDVAPGATIRPADTRLSMLAGGLDGIVNVIANGDSRMVPQAGLVWLLAGSRTGFEAGKDSVAHFVTIVFSDSALP